MEFKKRVVASSPEEALVQIEQDLRKSRPIVLSLGECTLNLDFDSGVGNQVYVREHSDKMLKELDLEENMLNYVCCGLSYHRVVEVSKEEVGDGIEYEIVYSVEEQELKSKSYCYVTEFSTLEEAEKYAYERTKETGLNYLIKRECNTKGCNPVLSIIKSNIDRYSFEPSKESVKGMEVTPMYEYFFYGVIKD